MKLEELIKTVQKIDLLSKSVSKQKLAGGNPSPFKGRGIVLIRDASMKLVMILGI